MEDFIAWLPVKSGVYESKSGYALAKINNTSVSMQDFDWKRCVWNIKTSPKLRTFIWKLKNKAVAVGRNLTIRGITDARRCKYCNADEDELHIILFCPFAAKVWELALVLFKPEGNVLITMNQFLEAARRHINLPPTGLATTPLFPRLLWNLWKARNHLIFEDRRTPAEVVVLRAITEARAWQDAQETGERLRPTQIAPRPPVLSPHAIQCFTDASWLAETREGGLGWCFKDSNLRIIAKSSTSMKNVASALIAEALALKAALIAAKLAGFQVMNCFLDSLSLVTLINTDSVINESKSVLHDIRCLKDDFNSISFVFIPRSENVLAD